MHTNKALAQHTLNIFESLNARPPGWLGSLAVLSTHFVSVVMAAVFTVVLIMGQRGSLHGFWRAPDRKPKTDLSWESLAKVKTGPGADFSQRLPITIVATFARPGAAESAWNKVAAALPQDAIARLFGSSVLLALPPNDDISRKHWIAEFQKEARDVFVASTNFYAQLTLTCVAPDEQTAKALEDELDQVFGVGDDFPLIPPWFPNDSRTPEQQEQHRLARQTLQRLERAGSGAHKSPALESLLKKMGRASRQADQTTLTQLQEEYKKMQADFVRQDIEKIRAEGASRVDLRVVDLETQRREQSLYGRTNLVHQQLGQLLGCVPTDPEGEILRASDKRFLTSGAYVTRQKSQLTFGYLGFYDVYHGAPALITWLHNRGCQGFKYRFANLAADADSVDSLDLDPE